MKRIGSKSEARSEMAIETGGWKAIRKCWSKLMPRSSAINLQRGFVLGMRIEMAKVQEVTIV